LESPVKILWISLRLFDGQDESQTAVWLKALALKIAEKKEVILCNVSNNPLNNDLIRCDYQNIIQWAIPIKRINRQGYPNKQSCLYFAQIVDSFMPDIIQVWGSENPLKLLPFDMKFPGVKVLTMQGVMASIAPVMLNAMSRKEILSTYGVREIVKRRGLCAIKKSFQKDGKLETKMIARSNYIITQSEWTKKQIVRLNSSARYFRTGRILREPFINSKKWSDCKHEKPIIYSAAVGYSLKGLHVLIKALAIITKEKPGVELRLAGATGRRDFLGDGYLRFILKLIKRNSLESNVVWLGAITADEIVEQLQVASVFVNPSFVESYSMVVAEAMMVGTPSVISLTGAMSELAENNVEALFFEPGNYAECAANIMRLLNDQALALGISKNAIKRAIERQNNHDIAGQQVQFYYDILSDEKIKNGHSPGE